MKTDLTHWPTVQQVRDNYLDEDHPYAYAFLKGYSDYHPGVVRFSLGGDRKGLFVVVSFFDGNIVSKPKAKIESLTWL